MSVRAPATESIGHLASTLLAANGMNAKLAAIRALRLTFASWISLGAVVAFGICNGCSSQTLAGGTGGGGSDMVVDAGGGGGAAGQAGGSGGFGGTGGVGGATGVGGGCWTCSGPGAHLPECPGGFTCFDPGASACCAGGMQYKCICPPGGHDCGWSSLTCPAQDAGVDARVP